MVAHESRGSYYLASATASPRRVSRHAWRGGASRDVAWRLSIPGSVALLSAPRPRSAGPRAHAPTAGRVPPPHATRRPRRGAAGRGVATLRRPLAPLKMVVPDSGPRVALWPTPAWLAAWLAAWQPGSLPRPPRALGGRTTPPNPASTLGVPSARTQGVVGAGRARGPSLALAWPWIRENPHQAVVGGCALGCARSGRRHPSHA